MSNDTTRKSTGRDGDRKQGAKKHQPEPKAEMRKRTGDEGQIANPR